MYWDPTRRQDPSSKADPVCLLSITNPVSEFEEADLGERSAAVIDFQRPRRASDPGPSTGTNNPGLRVEIRSPVYDPSTTLHDHHDTGSSPLSSRDPSISSEPDILITPIPSRAQSLDTIGVDSLQQGPITSTKETEFIFRTSPNARITRREPSSSLRTLILLIPDHGSRLPVRPTTFWRHHPLSPHAPTHHSPSSRVIRRSALIASTASVQQPDPDEEATRIAIGLAGIGFDGIDRLAASA